MSDLCKGSQSLSTAAVVGFTVAGVIIAEAVVALLVYFVLRLRSRAREHGAEGAEAAVAVKLDDTGAAGLQKSPVGSFMERWLRREGGTSYSPVVLEEDVPLAGAFFILPLSLVCC
ncbi:hypothetical protein JCM10213_008479 [Rhodosporidiobolus nylandii]